MTFEHALLVITRRLQDIYSDITLRTTIGLWILEHITGKTQAHILTHKNQALSATQEAQMYQILQEHVEQHKPLQYIFGSVDFLDLTLLVEPPVLIPRPETEQWCQELIAQLSQLPASAQQFTILDMCTGSGCIALALAKAFTQAHVYAVDISPQACNLVQQNAAKNNISNVTVLQSDLFTAIPAHNNFDLIVSNPPYVTHAEWQTLDLNVKNWEDYKALVAPANGLALLDTIAQESYKRLVPRTDFAQFHIPQFVIEMGASQGIEAQKLVQQAGFCHVAVKQDLAGKDRIVTGGIPLCGPSQPIIT